MPMNILFEFHFSENNDPPILSNMKFIGEQEVNGISNGMTIKEIKEELDDIVYTSYSFSVEENERYVLQLLDGAEYTEPNLYSIKYNFEDYYIRVYAAEEDGEVLYYEVGGI